MLELILLIAKVALVIGVFAAARRFVRDRLRFVDSVQNKLAPWIAGAVTTLVALPVVAVLPFVGLWTAVSVGIGAGAGVFSGARDVRQGTKELPAG
jgi:hypothetical protein